MRDTWSSRSTFILAAVGSAVGLGNAWRFPGLAAKYGGGAFLFVYLIAMLIIGIPLLMMEISIGRHTQKGAPGSMRAINKKSEPIGWMGVANGMGISVYYAAVFAWVILMFFSSFKFASMTGDTDAASMLWF
ncbi:MAG: sodium-dependent transporter, partial [Bacillota bacterium]|nr:sodium-dependent transporter [Bacillota bacterium]